MPRITKISRSLVVLMLLLAAAMLFPNLPQAQAAPAWSAPQVLSPGDFNSHNRNPEIALDASGNSHVVWVGYNGSYNILYSTNASGSWSEPLTISSLPVLDSSIHPQIAVDSSGHPHVVWRGFDQDWNQRILYASNSGSGWSEPEAVPGNNLNSNTNPMMALDSNDHPHVVWYGYDGTNDRIYYNTYSGTSWLATSTDVSGSLPSYQVAPQIALDGSDHPHVVWYGYDGTNDRIYYNTYSGSAWLATPTEISAGLSSSHTFPDIAIDGNNHPHVVWSGYNGSNLKVYYNTYSGSAWLATPTDISSGPSYLNFNPEIVIGSDNHPQVVWRDYEGGEDKIYYNVFSGTSWLTTATDISSGVSSKYDPDIALDPDNQPHVVWTENVSSSDPKIYYNTLTGTGWLSAPTEISGGLSSLNDRSSIAVDGDGSPHVVWFGGETSGRYEVWYSEKSGTDWSTPQDVSLQTLQGSIENRQPQVAVGADGRRHAVWCGYDGTDYQAYYTVDSGAGWSTPLVLSTNSYENFEQQLALGPEGNPQVVWTGKGDKGNETRDVFCSTNSGTSWTEPQMISEAGSSNEEPRIAAGAGNVPHVVWSGIPSAGEESARSIYFATRAGSVWTEPLAISTTSFWNKRPQVAMGTDGQPQVVWMGSPVDTGIGHNVYYNNRTGTGWAGPVTLSEEAGSSSSNMNPQLAIDMNNVPNVVWTGSDTGYPGQYIFYAVNPGTGWTVPVEISKHAFNDNVFPQIALGPLGVPQVVWDGQASEGEPYHIYYGIKQDTGWTDPLKLSGDLPQNYYPHIAVDSSNRPHVCWKGLNLVVNHYTSTVLYTTDPGTGWEAPQALFTDVFTDMDRMLLSTCITLDTKDNVHMVWDGVDSTGVIRAWYADNVEYDVTAAVSGGHGSVSPASQQVVPGGTATIDLTPESGYHVASVTDNGSEVLPTPTSPYVISDVKADHDVVVTFEENTFTWYLPEGSTDGGMETWILLENPYAGPVTVDLVFDTGSGEVALPALAGLTVPAQSRISYNVTSFITTYDLSTRVIAHGRPVFCRRSTYGNNRAWGTTSEGFPATADAWCMPEGSADGGMESWILVQNPNDVPVDVALKFLTGSGEVAGSAGTLAPHTRSTWRVNDWVTTYDVATEVTSSGGGVVCERATYGGEQAGSWAWGTSSAGAAYASAMWCVPGMHAGDSGWILVANPNTSSADIDIKFYTDQGLVQGPQTSVPARSRATFNVGDYVAGTDASAVVNSSGVEVVCEWAEYAPDWSWGTSSLGLGGNFYWMFPEGSTDGGMNTSVTIFNPGETTVTADFTLFTGTGILRPAALQGVAIPAKGTLTANLNDYVTSYDVSAYVTADGLMAAKRVTSCPDSGWCTASSGMGLDR